MVPEVAAGFSSAHNHFFGVSAALARWIYLD